jgi:putative tryptophan/tyrosine transport system substrate-binding protein
MNRNRLWLLTVLLLASVHLSEGQQPTKIPRIGYLGGTSLSADSARTQAFREDLRELGYVEGKTL